ncbi:MAG: hypothetical protein KF789_03140 [Bdellovibrionaceae bacterium]|nr:hypothetical protein [Pseudobdellovibrionaceae bacterium]
MKQMKWGTLIVLLILAAGYGLRRSPVTSVDTKKPETRSLASSEEPTKAASLTPAAKEPPAPKGPSLAGATNEIPEIRRLRECLESEKCDYPQTDPQSYALGVGQDLQKSLKALATRLKAEPNLSVEAEVLARELVVNPDGHIQEGALAIFAELAPASENLEAIVEGLQMNPADVLILEQAGAELARYLGRAEEPVVHQFMAKTLTDGALFASQKAGSLVRGFLTPQSVSYYREVLKRLPPDSTKARYLRGSLDEFERRSQGG